MIPFNTPPVLGDELEYISKAIDARKLCGDGQFTSLCHKWLTANIGGAKALLTTSCTHALEMAALLCDIKQDDEVIMPSYTFSSTANAFALRGAKIVFTDIRPNTMNIDESLIESAITERTKAIVPVHYAGVSCDMDAIVSIADKYGIFVVEDAAQAITSTYKGRNCGAIGDFGCFSFHETKNISCGEGGALIIRNGKYSHQAEIIREKGTNRYEFLAGEVDKYSWVSRGSSYLPSELNAAYLLPQLERSDEIMRDRMASWNSYYSAFEDLREQGRIELPYIPPECTHNAHMFYIKVKDIAERIKLVAFLKENGVNAVFHYVPLHSAEAGLKYSRFNGEDKYTTHESERLLRLPMYYSLAREDNEKVTDTVIEFYKKN
jgi:dTDP-4-amino-4,6-dideoxygalactose transaminase